MTTAAVFAYHDMGVRCLRALVEGGVSVPLVLTHGPDPEETAWFASVAATARELGIEVHEDPAPDEVHRRLREARPDFIFSFSYRRLLPLEWLALARKGAFNMHGSLLPKYRGRAPVNWAVLMGERETGATLHEMVARADAGRIVDQERVSIGPDETAAEVLRRVTAAGEAVLRRSLPALVGGTARLVEQDLARGGYFGRRRPEDGRIDWSKSALEIHNLVRAVAPPYPGAYSGTLKVCRTALAPGRRAPAGRKGPYREGGEWLAACGDGAVLRLLEVEER